MLTFPSWIQRTLGPVRAALLGRLTVAVFGVLMAADASAQTIQFTSSAYSVNENDGSIRVAVRRFGDANKTSTVVATAAGAGGATGAVDGVDFVARTSTLTFGTNVTEVFFDVVILDNAKTNANKFINLTLSNFNGATQGFPTTASVEILDDESGVAGFASGILEFSTRNYTVTDYEETVRTANGLSYPGAMVTVIRRGGNRGRILVDISTGTGTAYPNVLYIPFTNITVALDDYQMSTNFLVPVLQYTNFPIDLQWNLCWATNDTRGITNTCDIQGQPPRQIPPGIHIWPFQVYPIQSAGNSMCFNIIAATNATAFSLGASISPTWYVPVILSNPRLDPQEDQSLPAPTLGNATANLGIAFVDALKQNNTVLYQELGFSWERAHYRATEEPSNLPSNRRNVNFYQMWVNRDGCPDNVTVRYEVNNENSAAIGGDHLLRTFALQAGSDYATPFVDYLPPGTPEYWQARQDPQNQDDAKITWGPTERGPKPATIALIRDDKVEFEEDMLVQLFQRPGDVGLIAPSAAPPFGPAPVNATLTIIFDLDRIINSDEVFHYAFDTNGVFGAEQPSGAVDRRYNRHGENDIDPPFNPTPGANNSVLATAVGQDGKLYIGGEFDAVNTKKSPYVNHFARMTRDGQVDTNFVVGNGPNGAVTALELQPDGKILLGGLFSSYGGQLRNGMARVNTNGTLDATFSPGLGANGPVRAMKLQADGKILIGGEFTSVNGTNVNYLARLNPNGSLDTSFNAGGSGPDDFVYSISVSGDATQIHELASLDVGQRRERADVYDTGSNEGTIVLEYDFANTPDNIRVYYAGQLLADTLQITGQGTLTIPYGPGPVNSTLINVIVNEGLPGLFSDTASWSYRLTISPKLDNQPVIGGKFTHYNGVLRGRVARLTVDGGLDSSFDPGLAIESGTVFSVVKHGIKPLIGGGFFQVNRLPRNNIAQFNPDGSVDAFFDPGSGFDDIVNTLTMHSSGKVVAGGVFTSFNGSRRIGVARINHDGKLDTTFMDTAYNQFAGIPQRYAALPPNSINAMSPLRVTNDYSTTVQYTLADNSTTNITFNFTRVEDQLFIGGSFREVGGGYFRDDRLPRNNFARLWAGVTPGPGMAGLLFDNYFADEDSGYVFVSTTRDLGGLAAITGEMFTSDLPQGPGTATESLDYVGVDQAVSWARVANNRSRKMGDSFRGPNSAEFYVSDEEPGHGLIGTNDVTGTTSALFVPILDDSLQEGDEQLQLNFALPNTFLTLGGVPIPLWPALGRSTARLTIVDNDFNPGVIGFDKTQYFVDENGKKAHITLIRTNGSAGRVSVDARTRSAGTTATPGVDYVPISVVTVVFAAGQTNAAFDVDIIDDTAAELDETVGLALSNPTGQATISQGLATLTIVDNDFAAGRLSFTSPTNSIDEGSGVINIAIKRSGGSLGSEQVQVSTSDLTARDGIDYLGTNIVLRWASGDTADKIVTIPIIDTAVIDGTRQFTLTLSSPLVNGVSDPNALGNQKTITVSITDNDAYGSIRFSQPQYVVDENGTNAAITLIRVGGVTGEIGVGYTSAPELAIPGQDYTPVSGSFVFTNGQTSATFVVPIIDDNVVDGTKTVILSITGQTNDPAGAKFVVAPAEPSTVKLSIIDNELENIPAGSLDVTFVAEGANEFIYSAIQQDDGSVLIGGDFTQVNSVLRNRLARLNQDGTLDPTFFPGAGPDKSVRAMAIQQDGSIVIGGAFTNYNGSVRNFVARLVKDGGLDPTFDPGAGANNPVFSLILQGDGKILIGGNFSAYGPDGRNGIARLNQNGTLDTTFNPGTGAAGSVGMTVYALAQQLDGKILAGGDFTSFNATPANHLVRLKLDGSVDTSFNMSVGVNGSVRAIAVQPDGRILIGGLFTQVQGVAANGIARLNQDGTVDTTFNSVVLFDPTKKGANGAVLAIAVQIDGKIVLGGDFTQFNGVTRRGLTRLNSDGQNDPTINFGTGVNGSVASITVQSDRRIIIAGGFTEYDGQPKLRIARINGGSLKGAGRLEFANASYTVSEAGTNAVITVRRVGGTASSVSVHYQTADDPSVPANLRAVPGTDFVATSGDVTFAEGETQATISIPVINDTLVEPDKIFDVVLSNPTGQSGADQPTLGDQASTRVVETSDDSEVSFQVPTFTVGESIPSGAATITISRVGAISVPLTVTLYTKDGTATSGADYIGITNTVTFGIGESQRNVAITILPDLLVEGNEFVNLYLTNIVGAGGFKTGGAAATLTIIDDDFAPGQIQFLQPSYSIKEGNVVAEITVIRTNGLTGVVTVEYATSAVSATPDRDYQNVSGILTFGDGISSQVIRVPIFDDDFVENNEVINIALTNPHGGATLGLANATLTIIDDDLGSGSLDTSFDPGSGANGTIRAAELDASRRFVIAGDFTAFNNDASRSRIARLLQSGALDASFKTNNRPNNSVASLALYPPGDQRIMIGGNFSTIQGTNIENKVSRLDADGGLDTSFQLPLGLNAQVSSIAVQTDGKVVIGGVFDKASEAQRNHIARLNSNGFVDISFDPGTGADRNVNVVTLQSDNMILIGGEFNTVNGIGSGRIARLNQNGTVDTTFSVGAGFSLADGRTPTVYDIVILPTGNILVAGDFTAYKGVARKNIAVLKPNGDLDTTFAATPANINGAIRSVAVQATDRNSNGKLIIGGDFTSIDGTPRGRVARLEADGKFDPSFDPGDGANDSVLGVIVQPWDGRVVVVGAFTQFNNNPALHGIARMNNDKAFLPSATSEIRFGGLSIQGSDLSVTFTGDAGVNYVIEGTSDFNTWTTVKSLVGSGASTTTSVPIDRIYRFFRVRAL